MDSKDAFGGIPLHLAVDKGYTEIVRILVDAGADLNSALFVAVDKGNA